MADRSRLPNVKAGFDAWSLALLGVNGQELAAAVRAWCQYQDFLCRDRPGETCNQGRLLVTGGDSGNERCDETKDH